MTLLPIRTAAIALLLLASGLSGCIGSDPDEAVDAASVDAGDATGAAADPLSTDATGAGDVLDPVAGVDAPTWLVGDSFDMTLSGGGQPIDFTAVVTAAGSSYTVSTDSVKMARYEAMWDWFVLGPHAMDLAEQMDEGTFQMYDFPLTDGATWNVSPLHFGDIGDFTATATFNEAIATEKGTFPGFDIVVMTAHGGTAYEYDYVPAIGWFSTFTGLNPFSDQREEWFTYTITDVGHNWTGAYYTTRTSEIVANFHHLGADPDGPVAEPAPAGTFTVSAEATGLYAMFGAYANTGAASTVIVDPDGGTETIEAVGPPQQGQEVRFDDFLDPIPGEWRYQTNGAGQMAAAWVHVIEFVDEERTL